MCTNEKNKEEKEGRKDIDYIYKTKERKNYDFILKSENVL